MMDHRGQMVQEIRRNHALMRFHAIAFGDHSGVGQLVEALLPDTYRKAGDRGIRERCRHGGNETGIDAAAEEGANADIAQKVHLHGIAQERVEAVRDVALTAGQLVDEIDIPVFLEPAHSVTRSEEHTSGLQSLMRNSYY